MKKLALLIFMIFLPLTACKVDKASVEQGQEFGKTTSIRGCTNQAFQYYEACKVSDCRIVPSDFAKGCVVTAKIDKVICSDIPIGSTIKSVEWMDTKCKDHSDPKTCQGILKHTVGRCIAEGPEEEK